MKTIVEEKASRTVLSASPEAAVPAPTPAAQVSISIKSILVPLDFSRAAMHALDYAAALAKQLNAQIHLVHVQMPDEACAVPGAGHLMRECAESVTFLREKLGGLEAERPPQFWPENCHIRTGRAYEEICGLARELDVDLIVLASRGVTGLKRVLLGSTAERVVRFSPRPVLVVRPRKRKSPTKAELRIHKILVPTDFSQCALAGLIHAAYFARQFHARLRLVHVLHQPRDVVLDRVSVNVGRAAGDMQRKDAELEMAALLQLDFLHDIKCETQICTGTPVDEICGETLSPDMDLVVTSTHGRSGFNRILLGSVAEHVVRYAECPVLVVPNRCSTS